MAKATFYVCDTCNSPILDPNKGFVVHGNIYAATTDGRGGLVGNNFPENADAHGRIMLDQVKETSFCVSCLLQVLGIEQADPFLAMLAKKKPGTRCGPRGCGPRHSPQPTQADIDHEEFQKLTEED